MVYMKELKQLVEKSEQDILKEKDSKVRGSYGTTGSKKLLLIKKYFEEYPLKSPPKILDVGGTDFTYKALKLIFPKSDITTLNIQKYHVRNCKKVLLQNAEEIKTKEKFDIIVIMELFEHLKADKFMMSARRVLKDKGLLVLSCPNLASWYNRIFLLFGHQPPSYDISDMYKLCPMLPPEPIGGPAGHKTLVTLKEMKTYLTKFGFRINKIYGFPYAEKVKEMSRLRYYLDKILPLGLKEGMLFIAKKVKEPAQTSVYYNEWIKSGLIYN
jgi:SAM-dependent methyltransferase